MVELVGWECTSCACIRQKNRNCHQHDILLCVQLANAEQISAQHDKLITTVPNENLFHQLYVLYWCAQVCTSQTRRWSPPYTGLLEGMRSTRISLAWQNITKNRKVPCEVCPECLSFTTYPRSRCISRKRGDLSCNSWRACARSLEEFLPSQGWLTRLCTMAKRPSSRRWRLGSSHSQEYIFHVFKNIAIYFNRIKCSFFYAKRIFGWSWIGCHTLERFSCCVDRFGKTLCLYGLHVIGVISLCAPLYGAHQEAHCCSHAYEKSMSFWVDIF